MGPRPRTGLDALPAADAGRLDADELDAVLAAAHPSGVLPRVERRRVPTGQRAAAVVALLYVLTGTVLWLLTPAVAGRGVDAATAPPRTVTAGHVSSTTPSPR